MKIKLLAVGTKMPAWVNQPFEDYQKRLPRECALELIEINAAKRSKNQSSEHYCKQEGAQILKHIRTADWVVALDVKGQHWSTPQLASQLQRWQQLGQDIALVVGGPDGLDHQVLARANQRWSLSALTFPHPLVRVILAEAIYRAWTLTVNHPYHRE